MADSQVQVGLSRTFLWFVVCGLWFYLKEAFEGLWSRIVVQSLFFVFDFFIFFFSGSSRLRLWSTEEKLPKVSEHFWSTLVETLTELSRYVKALFETKRTWLSIDANGSVRKRVQVDCIILGCGRSPCSKEDSNITAVLGKLVSPSTKINETLSKTARHTPRDSDCQGRGQLHSCKSRWFS